MTTRWTKHSYQAYLRSPRWQAIRARILSRAGDRCEWCGRFCGRPPHDPDTCCWLFDDCAWCAFYFNDEGVQNDRERQSLEIHHKTYERIGNEREDDLVALCWSCHDEVTDRTKELQRLARAGRLDRSDATPHIAATSFWATFLRGLGFTRKGGR